MTPEQYQRARELFASAYKLAWPEQQAYVERACGADEALRAEVRSLLTHDAAGANDLDTDPRPGTLPDHIGRYRILGVLGEGGMSVVYRAQQDAPRRIVALKVLRPGWAPERLLERLEHEAQFLARLQHPGIAQVFDAGMFRSEHGPQPFFAMECVQGASLTRYVEKNRLSRRERLELLCKVCDAVEHAHQKGVIHRDLKPGNILVDDSGHPKVLDFGVARAVDRDIRTTTLQTNTGQLVGTIPYMSPEQAGGDPAELDTRSDVYALGVIVFELLTGRLPYDIPRGIIPEALRVIREHEPLSLGSVDRALRGDLATIVGKTLEKDKTCRYQSASELAADIRRYINNEPIVAHPPSTAYQLRKFARRNRGLVATAGAILVALIGGIITTSVALSREADQRRRAEVSHREARWQAYRASIAAAAAALRYKDPITARRHLDEAPPEYRNWEWRYLDGHADHSRMVLRAHEAAATSAAFNRDGVLATSSLDRSVRLWNISTGASVGEPLMHDAGVHDVVFVPGATRLAAACDDGRIVLWDWRACERIREFDVGASGGVTVATSPDGGRIAAASNAGRIRVWDTASGKRLFQGSDEHPPTDVAFNPHNGQLVSTCEAGQLHRWDLSSEQVVDPQTRHDHTIQAVAWSPDGRRIATASGDRTIRIDDEPPRTPLLLKGHARAVTCVSFNPDGARIVSTSRDNTVRLWDAAAGTQLTVLGGYVVEPMAVAFSSDGATVAAVFKDGMLRVWDAEPREAVIVLRGHESFVYPVAYSPDTSMIASGGWDNVVRLWNARDGTPQDQLTGHTKEVTALCFSSDGSKLISASADQTVRIWNVKDRTLLGQLTNFTRKITGVACGFDGRLIATASWDATIRLYETDTGRLLETKRTDPSRVNCIAFDGDGRLLAAGLTDGSVLVWRVRPGPDLERIAVLHNHTTAVSALAFRPSHNAVLATAATNEPVLITDLNARKSVQVLQGRPGVVYDLHFSPDGTRLAVASEEHDVRIWDPDSGMMVLDLHGHEDYVYSVEFSSDGMRLVSGSGDHTIRIWNSLPYPSRIERR